MKKQINDLLLKMEMGKNDVGATANAIVDLITDKSINAGKEIELKKFCMLEASNLKTIQQGDLRTKDVVTIAKEIENYITGGGEKFKVGEVLEGEKKGFKPSITNSLDLLMSGKGTFGCAVDALKYGHTVCRFDWNGTYLSYIEGKIVIKHLGESNNFPWMAMEKDIFAEDWKLVGYMV